MSKGEKEANGTAEAPRGPSNKKPENAHRTTSSDSPVCVCVCVYWALFVKMRPQASRPAAAGTPWVWGGAGNVSQVPWVSPAKVVEICSALGPVGPQP